VRQALACVKALGHTRVALAGGPSTSDLSARWVAYSTAFARSWTDVDLVDLGGFALDVAGGIAAAGRAVASGATAVCTYHDVIAQGVLEGLRRAGVEVPGRMSVIGAGEPAGSAAIAPALTRVEVPMVDAGRASVDLLISLLRDRATRPAHHWDLDVHLAIRDTTGPLRVLRR
jgi:LacI family transcriptional regulator